MKTVFVTHNDLGLACLEELADIGADLQAVYTRPERESISDQTDFQRFAARNDVPLHRVDSVNSDRVLAQLSEYDPELLFVVGWSRLVDQHVIDTPSVAALGMHPAPLPRGRGRAPVAWSLIKGLGETKLSLFHLVEEADAGDLVEQESIEIDITDDARSLYEKVAEAGRRLVRTTYPTFEQGTVPREPQDEDDATWWPKREPRHGVVDWTRSPEAVYNWIRGQTRPYPGAFSYLNGQKVTFWAAKPPTGHSQFVVPGEIVSTTDDSVVVGAWEGVLEIAEIQVAGDEPIAGNRLTAEYDTTIGDSFETMPAGDHRS